MGLKQHACRDQGGNVIFTINAIGEGSEFIYSDSIVRPDLPKRLLLQSWRVRGHDGNAHCARPASTLSPWASRACTSRRTGARTVPLGTDAVAVPAGRPV
jgi:hypothetical protein